MHIHQRRQRERISMGIEAGWGIVAALSITAKKSIVCSLLIFAGVCHWRLADEDEKKITCSKLESGTVAYGILVETGEAKEVAEIEGEIITLNGKKYKAID